MRFHSELEHSTIRRLYEQGLESIVRLVSKLEDRILHLEDLQLSDRAQTVEQLSAQIKRVQQTLEQKSQQLIQVHQLNSALLLRIRELESCLETDDADLPKRDSHNSHQPPALDLPWQKPKRTRSLRKKSNRNVGGQLGHRGVTLLQVNDPDRIIVHSLERCPECQLPFAPTDAVQHWRRQVFNVEDGRLTVTEHRAAMMRCRACAAMARSFFPASVKAPVQYGADARAKSLYLHLYQLIPVARTAEAMRDLFACPMSPATIQHAARLCAGKLVRSEQRTKAAIRQSAIAGVDETGIRINGTVAWVHVARTETLTHFESHAKRGKAAFDQIGIINRFKGTLVRDGWSSYKWYSQCRHSLCNAHLLRDLTFIAEAYPANKSWTNALARLLIEMKEAVADAREGGQIELDTGLQTSFLKRYDAILGEAASQVCAPARASPLKSSQLSPPLLLNRFWRNKQEILRFMFDLAVPFDNNGSERDLRMLKLQQKISGCFRTIAGATTFCRIRSYLSSARKQSRSVLAALERAVNGQPMPLTA